MQTRWLVVALLALGGRAWAFDVPTRMMFRDVQYDVRSVDLPSGMRVVVEKDPTRPLVAVVGVVDVGGADDPPGKEGLAHLVEHLTFRSIQDQKHAFNDLLEVAGAARWNASTSWDLTTYYEVGSKESLDALVALEVARLARPLQGVTPEVFEAERQVVKNELLQRDEQGFVTAVWTRMAAALFPPGHPNSRPVAGTEASIAALTLEDAKAFVQKYYRPERMTFLLAGDLDPAALAKSLPQKLPAEFMDAPATGPVPVKSRLPASPRAVEDPKSGRDLIRVRAPSDVPVIIVGWPLPSGYDKDGYYGLFIAGMAAQASVWAVAHDPDLIGISSSIARGRTGSVLLIFGRLREGANPARSGERMLDELNRLWTATVVSSSSDAFKKQEAEFLIRRNETLIDLASELEDVGFRAVMRAELVHVTGDTHAMTRELGSIGQLTTGSVSKFAFDYLDRGRARMVFLEPDGTPAPAEGRGTAFAAAPGLQLRISPEVLRTRVAAPGAQLRAFTLDSGLEVILARRPTAPVVTLTFSVRGGTADSEPLGAASFAQYARPVDRTRGNPANFGIDDSISTARDSASVQMVAGNGNLANALGFLLDEVRSLHVDAAVERYVDRELRTVYRKDWTTPRIAFDRALWSAVYGSHPYGRAVPPDAWDKVGGGEAQRYLDRAFVPANGVLVVAGDLDLKEAEEMVRDYFGGWKTKADQKSYATGSLPQRAAAPVPLVKEVRPGARQVELRFGCAVPASTPSERAAADVLAHRLGGRIHRFARQMLGTSYGFFGRATPRPGVIEIEVSGSVDLAGAAKVLALLRSEASNLGARALDPAELARSQWDAGLQASTRYEASSWLAPALARLRLAGYPADTLERYPQDLAALTPAGVQALAAECRKTAAIGLLGEQATLDRIVPTSG